MKRSKVMLRVKDYLSNLLIPLPCSKMRVINCHSRLTDFMLMKKLCYSSCLPGLDPGSRHPKTLKFYWIPCQQTVSQLKKLYFFSCRPGLDPGSRFRNTLKFFWIPCQARGDENPTNRIISIVTQSASTG